MVIWRLGKEGYEMFKKFNTLFEEDFAFFRIPFKSRRQTLTNLKKGLYFGIFLQTFLSFIHFFIWQDPVNDFGLLLNILLVISFSISIILIIMSIIFTLPSVYQQKQHTQYLVVSLMLLNVFGLSMYTIGLYLLQMNVDITENAFRIFVIVSIFLYAVFMIFVFMRLTRSLMKGEFREDTGKYDHERALKQDKKRTSKFLEFTVVLIGIIFIVQFMLNNFVTMDVRMMILTIIMLLLPYLMLYMFGHSLITYYCKKRFASFNFDDEENLNPSGSGDKLKHFG